MSKTDLILTAIIIFFAAAVATLVRVYDPPVKVDTGTVVSTFVYSLVAAIIVAWAGMAGGLNIASPEGFGLIAGSAVGGMATVKAFLAKAAPPPT